jgi:hypothetical protein
VARDRLVKVTIQPRQLRAGGRFAVFLGHFTRRGKLALGFRDQGRPGEQLFHLIQFDLKRPNTLLGNFKFLPVVLPGSKGRLRLGDHVLASDFSENGCRPGIAHSPRLVLDLRQAFFLPFEA